MMMMGGGGGGGMFHGPPGSGRGIGDRILDEDKARPKQQHTSKRIFERWSAWIHWASSRTYSG